MNPPSTPVPPAPAERPLRVVLLSAAERAEVVAEARRLRTQIEPFAQIVATDFHAAEDLAQLDADVAVVLGGDGSILRAVHQMGGRQLPVIAVNLGKLGFLADVSPDELPAVLRDFRAGRLTIIEHLMFDCRVTNGGVVRAEKMGLNETAVHSGPPFSVMEVDLYVDSELVTTYSCDGLIISTPVGSTAHSLSAGGPILRKDLQAFVIMPISPHSLTNRPVVDAAERVYEMEVARPRAETSVVVDGQVLCRLQPGDRVSVRRADCRFQLVAAPGHSYYRTLREKLGWSGQIERRMKDER
ncbi:MAG: NAD(+)/NADH kinase [Thermoguttaceae bacterium]